MIIVNIINILFLFSLTFWYAESNDDSIDDSTDDSKEVAEEEHFTALAIKQGIHDYKNSIALGTTTFKDLVKQSKMFIDNTLFIREHVNYFLLHGADSVLSMTPSKWGRTTLLDMMKTFVEIEVDDQGNEILPKESTSNYKLFANGEITLDNGHVEKLEKPLLIAKEETFMTEYQGRFPAIYITLKNTIAKSVASIERKIRIAISQAFKQHEYMIKVLEKKHDANSSLDLQEFKDYLDQKEDTSLNGSLRFLCRVLSEHFNKKPFVFFDDYDKPIYSFLQPNTFICKEIDDRILDVILMVEWFILGTFRNNTYLHHGLITGTIKLARRIDYGWMANVIYYIVDEDLPTREFFAFNKKEVDLLFQMHNITGKLAQQAEKWYNGHQSNYSNALFYEPTSIIQFLNTKVITGYRKEDHTNRNFIHKSLERKTSTYLRHGMYRMLSKEIIINDVEFIVNVPEIYHMRKLCTDEWEKYWGENLFYIYMAAEGYLAPVGDSQSAHLVNNEMAFMIANWMISYYKREFHITEHLLQKTATTMLDFLTNEQNSTTTLEKSLTTLYKHCAPYIDNRNETYDPYGPFPAITIMDIQTLGSFTDFKEDPPLGILNCVILRVQCLTKFEIDVYYHKIQTADVLIIDNEMKRGVVIELTTNMSSAGGAFSLAQERVRVFKNFTQIKKAKFIGINVEHDKTVQVLMNSTKI